VLRYLDRVATTVPLTDQTGSQRQGSWSLTAERSIRRAGLSSGGLEQPTSDGRHQAAMDLCLRVV
jgi:hypothetical protein